ncbi:putative bifunctional diguanylate cyclase/phosphodiesterase [Marinobacter sp. M-5]|uniref:putative bifunctional diguanylate cyclase/phosphodiesterase n=1 Tax=Marinobacter sp. M-5 TaxID=3081089 RepID=UPI00293CDD21|nr:EAL domain-containing protein [Marinobacter sp. M-5]MDV3502742.1 EAL domain-containing protein [Marinobacter sp. M-5]
MNQNYLYEAVFREILHEVHIWQLVRDDTGRIKTWRLLDANPCALRNWGKTLAEVRGKTTDEIFPGVGATEMFLPIVEKIFREGKPYFWETYFEGTDQTLQMSSIPLDDLFISTGIDVSYIRRSERALTESQQRLAIATGAAHIGIWEYNINSRQLVWDDSMYQIYGLSASTKELAFETWQQSLHQEDVKEVTQAMEHSITNERDFKSEFRVIDRETGRTKHILADAVFRKGSNGESDKMIGVNIDISDRRRAEQRIEVLSYFDTLTGLPNRSMIEDRLNQSIALSERTQNYSSLLIIDIDNFQKINDMKGHAVGDELLKALANRVKKEIRKADTFGRFGGDAFVIILNNLDKNIKASLKFSEHFAQKVCDIISAPFELSEGRQTINVSFGISLFKNEPSPHEILRQADLAMHKAKESDRNRIQFYDPQMQKLFLDRVEIENELLAAINEGQIELHYQIQINDSGRVRGAEALARWQHPEKGTIPPSTFIPVAEETGMIKELGAWIFKTACHDLKEQIQQHVDDDFVLAVNVSGFQIFDEDFVEAIQSHIIKSGAPASQLKIEITESVIIHDSETMHKKMLALKDIGLKFSLDDFGTGFSSLVNLKRLPIDELKIDRSFIQDILSAPNSTAIARSVIALAESLDLDVIAEGVEESRQRDLLKEMGCTAYQGYFFSKPLPLLDFLALVKERTGR